METIGIAWYIVYIIPDSKIHGAIMGPIWGQQDLGGPHVGPMNFAIWDSLGLYFPTQGARLKTARLFTRGHAASGLEVDWSDVRLVERIKFT